MLSKKLNNFLKSLFIKFGYKVSRIHKEINLIPVETNDFTMFKALDRCFKRGTQINTVIDVGASNGGWSKQCMKTFPNANYFLIEAQKGHEEALLKFKNEFSNINYIFAAAGKRNGTIYFDESGLFGGVASESILERNCIEVPMVNIDSEITKRKLKPPYLLKLDTHGFEVPIIEGAKETIKNAQLVIIETYNYKITDNSLKYYEMCAYMETLGFSPIEMVDFMLRKYDQTFWQMDTFFIPSSHKSFNYNAFK